MKIFITGMCSAKNGKLILVEDEQDEIKKPEKERIPSKKEKIGFIILDAGHGGKDPGAVGKGGLKEKTITLQLSKKVETLLKKRLENIKIKIYKKFRQIY